jgi:hypothetical protein
VVDATLSILAERATGAGYLLVVEGGSSSTVPLTPGARLLIGRVPEAQVRLSDAACSRRHATIVVEDEVPISTSVSAPRG